MEASKTLWKRFFIIAAIFHLPVFLFFLLPGSPVVFLPMLFWINIPVLWTGIASIMGESHFTISAFGVGPQSALACIVIVIIWLLIAFALAKLSLRLKSKFF